MRTTATNKKIGEILRMMRSGELVPKPDFQRRLIWTTTDKNYFIDSVLNGYPFPEIYFAEGEVNTDTAQRTVWLVDGQQRITTLFDYFEGKAGVTVNVPSYALLTDEQKRNFLSYEVVVRELGSIPSETIIEVFRRLNATSYSLNQMELDNARFNGGLKRFADSISQYKFFEDHKIFSNTDIKRMGDTKFILTIIITMLSGYFNREDNLQDWLEAHNDGFEKEEEVKSRIDRALGFIDEMAFDTKSRAWKKADFFSLFIEVDRFLGGHRLANTQPPELSAETILGRISTFYNLVDDASLDNPITDDTTPIAAIYAKAAQQANNARINRVRRRVIMEHVINNDMENALEKLIEVGAYRNRTT